MTDLQAGLIIGGVVVVLVVYGLNWWQALRYKKIIANTFAKPQQDVLLTVPKNMVRHGADGAMDPSFTVSLLTETGPHANAPSDIDEPSKITDTVPEADPLPPAHAAVVPENLTLDLIAAPTSTQRAPDDKKIPPVNEQITAETDTALSDPFERDQTSDQVSHSSRVRSSDSDRDITLNAEFYFMANIYAATPIDAAAMPILSAAKRIRCLGLRADKQWEVVMEGSLGQYYELKIGLQLVDRQGPLNLDDINAFSQTIQLFADQWGANVVFSQKQQKIRTAKALDQFCAETDVQIGLNLQATFELSLEKIAAFAAQHEMNLAADGAFHLTDEGGNTLFSLVNQSGKPFTPNLLGETHAISFVLDVPRVANGGDVFEHMCVFATRLADVLGAELVDDNQQPLTEPSLSFIRNELVQIQNKMQAQGIAAGSALALQLYA